MTEKLPPYSEIAEQAVLSAMLSDERALLEAREILTAESFFRPAHEYVFAALCDLFDCGTVVDPITLVERLRGQGQLDRVGGNEYIAYLVGAVPGSANVKHHASIVREMAQRRNVIRVADELSAAAYDRSLGIEQAAQQATSALLPVAASSQSGGYVKIGDLVTAVAQDIENASQGKMAGLSWGYRDVDRETGGITPGELAFFCSVPGGCKTALALNIALTAAERGEGVGFVSAEMKDRSLVKRLVSNRASVAGFAIRTGRIADAEYADLGTALGALSRLPLWIDDTPEPDIGIIKARARSLKAKHPAMKWLFVDFIQLVLADVHSDDGRALALSRISYGLKGLAKELDVAVVATCQVDAAGIEKRGDKRPQLGDMQWSQAMRQAADYMALMYRAAMYSDMATDVIEVDFRKCRDLEPFKVTLNWIGKYMRVEDQSLWRSPS